MLVAAAIVSVVDGVGVDVVDGVVVVVVVVVDGIVDGGVDGEISRMIAARSE